MAFISGCAKGLCSPLRKLPGCTLFLPILIHPELRGVLATRHFNSCQRRAVGCQVTSSLLPFWAFPSLDSPCFLPGRWLTLQIGGEFGSHWAWQVLSAKFLVLSEKGKEMHSLPTFHLFA